MVRRQAQDFLHRNWQFGEPRPKLFFDGRVLAERVIASLITSSNFTDRGQRRHIEAGFPLEDIEFATLTANFRGGSRQAIEPLD